ncbi:MAG: insulinase family protein, partial [Alphaproteobacteria bacterium]|nr:insulinase family protein [Alphaproteobacteria bacterium]
LYASPRPGTKVEDVAAAVKSEIQRLLKDGVTEKEVREAVTRLQDAAVFARDSINGPAQIFGGALAIGLEVEDVESWPDRIGAVTAEAVNRVARSVLGSVKPVTAVLLPDETI